jgi:hypothetical protein
MAANAVKQLPNDSQFDQDVDMETKQPMKTEGAQSIETNRRNDKSNPSVSKGLAKASPKSLEAPNSKRRKTAWRKKHFQAPRR